MRYVGVGNVTTAGLALALPERWELWRAFARARIVSLCRTADRWDVAERRVWRQPSNASKDSSGSTAGSPALRLTRPKVAVRTGPAASGTVMCARTRPDLGRKRSPRLSFKRSTDSISL